MAEFKPGPQTKIKRIPERGSYEKESIYQILDEALICHVGIVQDGAPIVIPTIHARIGDQLVLHGAPASRLLKYIAGGNPVCVTVTLLDGLVLARSTFHHSMNYRSVVLMGSGKLVDDPQEKARFLDALVEHIIPGRSKEARGANEKELKATTVVSIPIEEASAKVRTGPPVDDEEDYSISVWAGVLPLKISAEAPVPDSGLVDGVQVPDYVSEYQRS
ncbi:MAG: pyridoxamine 5'-phosphate oxidase family protein [SAR324 cluster bacterium]|nr:pyridoxamine 5'-phosphate oxidase family protein [SAR324 cluster bacterium]